MWYQYVYLCAVNACMLWYNGEKSADTLCVVTLSRSAPDMCDLLNSAAAAAYLCDDGRLLLIAVTERFRKRLCLL